MMDMQKTYHKALAYLGRREHSQQELRVKLKRVGADALDVDSVLNRLVEEGYQDDGRFAIAYCFSRAKRGFGPIRISHELESRGVDSDIIYEVITMPDLDWEMLAITAWEKKYKDSSSNAVSDRAKQWKFLLYRGFVPEHIAFLR